MTKYINLPYALFDVEDLTGKIAEVTSWFRPVCYDKPKFRVKLTPDQWASLMSRPEMRTLYSFYLDIPAEQIIVPEELEYDRCIAIANAVFYVEKA